MWTVLGRIALVLGILAAIATILQYVEGSAALPHSVRWLLAMIPDVPLPILNSLVALTILSALWITLNRVGKQDERIKALTQKTGERVAIEEFRKELTQKAAELRREVGLNQSKWVDRPGEKKTFPCVTDSGELKHVTWDEVDELMTRNQPGYYRLIDRNPGLGEWYDRRGEP